MRLYVDFLVSIKFLRNSCLGIMSKPHHQLRKVLIDSFDLNGQALGFHPQT